MENKLSLRENNTHLMPELFSKENMMPNSLKKDMRIVELKPFTKMYFVELTRQYFRYCIQRRRPVPICQLIYTYRMRY